jgi:hypothetical protein
LRAGYLGIYRRGFVLIGPFYELIYGETCLTGAVIRLGIEVGNGVTSLC